MQGIARVPVHLDNDCYRPCFLSLTEAFQDWVNDIEVFDLVPRELKVSATETP
jgi:hypothetical protein